MYPFSTPWKNRKDAQGRNWFKNFKGNESTQYSGVLKPCQTSKMEHFAKITAENYS